MKISTTYKQKIAQILLCCILIIYLLSSNLTSGDSKWTLFSAMSIIKEGNTNLDEYHPLFKETDFRIEKINGHYYNIFPIGPTFASVPFVWSADALMRNMLFQRTAAYLTHRTMTRDTILRRYRTMEMYISSVFTAFSALFLFLWLRIFAARMYPADIKPRTKKLQIWVPVLLTLIYAFGTGAWSTASRALWQHGPSLFFITLALYLMERARRASAALYAAGATLALTYLMRPTNSIVIAGLSLYTFYTFKRDSWKLFAGAAPIALGFIFYNISKYGMLLPAYYLPSRLGTNTRLWEALAGNLISPARGIFIFSPVLLFTAIGALIVWREKKWNALDTVCAAIIGAHLIAISSFIHWWGGHSYGPRFFTDVLPFFIYFLLRFIMYLSTTRKTKRAVLTAVFSITLIASFMIHGIGANSWSAVLWNATPTNVDDKPERIWDWRDMQFLRW